MIRRAPLPSLALSAAAALASVAARAQAPAGFGWFGALAGSCWTGAFPDGATEHTQCYTVQFGKFLRGTAALRSRRDGQLRTTFEVRRERPSGAEWNTELTVVYWRAGGAPNRPEG